MMGKRLKLKHNCLSCLITFTLQMQLSWVSLLILLHCIALYCIVLYCIVLYCIVLYCIVLYCIVLYCIVLYCKLYATY